MSFWHWMTLPVLQRAQETVPEDGSDPTADPIEAITETTAQATEAATEFVDWIGSGELEALIALGLVVTFTLAQLIARWAILKGIVRLPQGDEFSFTALLQRVVKSFHTYFMVMIAFALTDAMLGLPQAVSVIVKIFFVLAAILQIAEWVQEFAVSFIRRNVARSSGDARALASAFNIIKQSLAISKRCPCSNLCGCKILISNKFDQIQMCYVTVNRKIYIHRSD